MEDRDKTDHPSQRRPLDLSVTQVAASAMAAVAGALLASELGVYGTILGAAVVSTGATVGSALFQHAFRRTGEQLRDLAATSSSAVPAVRPQPEGERRPFDPFDPGGEHTRMLASVAPPEAEAVALYRGRTSWRPRSPKPRSWKSWALMSVLVFGLAMGTVTAVELVAGKPAAAIVRDEPGSGTSLGGGTVHGGPGGPGGSPSTRPSGGASTPGGDPSDGASDGAGGTAGGGPGSGSPSPTPSATPSQGPTPSEDATPGQGQSSPPAPGGSQAAGPGGLPSAQATP
jgi:hypothetical protein